MLSEFGAHVQVDEIQEGLSERKCSPSGFRVLFWPLASLDWPTFHKDMNPSTMVSTQVKT
jgi:hypothetical protein